MQVSLPAWKGRRCLASTAACTAASAASESSIGRKPPTDRFRRNLESRKEDGSEPSVMAASVPLGLPLGACASLPRRACMHPRLLARTRRPSSITGQQQRAGGGWLEQAPQTAASRQRATPPASQEPEPPGAEAPLPPSEGPCLQVHVLQCAQPAKSELEQKQHHSLALPPNSSLLRSCLHRDLPFALA